MVTYRIPVKQKSRIVITKSDFPRKCLPAVDGAFVVDTAERLGQAVRMVTDAKILGVDIETVGCDPANESPVHCARVMSLQFSCGLQGEGQRIFVPNWGPYTNTIRGFKRLLEADDDKKVGHNIKYDMHGLANHGIMMRGLKGDTFVMDTLMYTGEMLHGLKECIRRYFDEETVEYKETFKVNIPKKKDGKPSKKWRTPSLDEVIEGEGGIEKLIDYGVKDPWYAVKLFHFLKDKLNNVEWTSRGSYWEYYKEFELPYTTVLFDMERVGLCVNVDQLAKTHERIKDEIQQLEHEFIRIGNKASIPHSFLLDFNMSSRDQIGILFEKHLGITMHARTKKTGKPKTDEAALESIRHPVGKKLARCLIERNKLMKLDGTYLQPLQEFARRYKGRIHTTLRHTGTATWRLCVSRDTKIEMPRDLKKYPDGVPISRLRENDLIYSYTWDKKLCLRKVKWVGITGHKKTIKITAASKSGHVVSVRLTPEHLIRTFKGAWKPAGMVKIGDRLLCMVHRGFDAGYANFWPNSKQRSDGVKGGGKSAEHRWIQAQKMGRRSLPAKWDVHHKDENKLNNSPNNLELVMHSAHVKMHNPGIAKDYVEGVLAFEESLTVHRKTLYRAARKYDLLPEYQSYKKIQKKQILKGTNHTVIAIEECDEEEVWDLEVEDTHTFIGNGIALHNSSANPNLQNIPRNKDTHGLRACFVEEDGYEVGDIDSSQMEMRLTAHYTNDAMMIRALRGGWDLHSLAATKAFPNVRAWVGAKTIDAKLLKEVKDKFPLERDLSKPINFGITYGMQAKRYAASTGQSERAGQEAIDGFFSLYPGLKSGIANYRAYAYKHGHIRTLLRRYIEIPALKHPNVWVRREGERQAFNYVIQGSAADILKMAMLLIHRDDKLRREGVLMNLQVHDELLFKVPKNEKLKKEITPIINKYVSEPYLFFGFKPLRIETPASIGFGNSWTSAKEAG